MEKILKFLHEFQKGVKAAAREAEIEALPLLERMEIRQRQLDRKLNDPETRLSTVRSRFGVV